MNENDLPELPEGMHWESYLSFWTAVDDVNGGAVTIDFTRRNFAMGWTSVYKPMGNFGGRGWRQKLVDAAVAALTET